VNQLLIIAFGILRARFLSASSMASILAGLALCVGSGFADAGPVDFGRAELHRAQRARGLKAESIAIELRSGPPETWSISPGRIVGGDERGLMYGLLEAAAQIRTAGKLTSASGQPATPMRGIRTFIHNEDLEKSWYYSREYWDAYFSMLATNRFNRLNLVFAHQTNYLAPPYPYWIELPDFPQIRVPGLSAAQRDRNLEMLRYISQSAADHGIEFTLGVWEHNVRPNETATVDGLMRENVGPYSGAALARILQLCPAIRSVQVRTNIESGIPDDQQVEFYRDHIFPAIKAAGRTLDFRAWRVAAGMMAAAKELGVNTRISAKYWDEDVGRPYQVPETYAGYGYLDFLEKPRFYQFFWELWGLGSHRLLLWGNPDFVRRAVPTFRLSDSIGFEIDAPLAQKGYGNRPGVWGIFTVSQQQRVFWKWEFERYWLFYLLWGRLSYDPQTSDAVWMDEMRRRFGPAASDVLDAYRESSRVLNEVVAVHLADPNMYIWPEINPGGLIDSYKEVLPSDWRYVASIPETVRNLLTGTASAKQTAFETADRLDDIARRIDDAVTRSSSKMRDAHREWEGSRPDFQVLASLARYHAHKQRAALNVEWFDTTSNRDALESAKRSLTAAVTEWESLVKLTDGLYPPEMASGPDDVGHWKDKLPYVRHDLELIREREEVFERFGAFDFGFDFGAPVSAASTAPSYRTTPYVLTNNVEPRFRPVGPETQYDEKTRYGWMPRGGREAGAVALTPYREVRGVARNPHSLPRDMLFRDYIRGEGDQVFLVRASAATYEVQFLSPDRTVRTESMVASDGFLRIRFPRGDWTVSGLVVEGPQARAQTRSLPVRVMRARPTMSHEPPASAVAGQPLVIALKVEGARPTSIRLHYRALNQNESFRTLEGGPSFTIPGEHISSRWDLLYYFEVLNEEKTGWFYPDPATATPYFVVATRSRQSHP
jgi:hypothetical protein